MSAHEDRSRQLEFQGGSDRSFGFVLAAFFAVVALLPLVRGGNLRLWALPIAGVFALFAWLWPKALHPLNRLWTLLGAALGRVVAPLAAAVLFFLVVTPIGLMLRLAKRDLLRLRYDAQATTYWLDRGAVGADSSSMKQQF